MHILDSNAKSMVENAKKLVESLRSDLRNSRFSLSTAREESVQLKTRFRAIDSSRNSFIHKLDKENVKAKELTNKMKSLTDQNELLKRFCTCVSRLCLTSEVYKYHENQHFNLEL